MAIERLTINGYGQIELNNCAFRRDGRIEAQCKPNTTDFSGKAVENGMILAVDNVSREVKLPVGDSLPFALNYSSEHIYDERTPGLKDFKLDGDKGFLPRLGYLSVGDKFTTNCVAYNSSEFATESAFVSALESYKTTALYAGVCHTSGTANVFGSGAWVVSATQPAVGPVARVISKTTLPDGTVGVKLQVYKA